MALTVCADCTAARAPDVRLCPHCGSERVAARTTAPRKEGDDGMPKISKHGGPSYAGRPEGGEETSPGSSSQTSPAKRPSGSKSSDPGPRKRARTAGSRSTPRPAEDSTAPSTGGDGQKTPSSDN